MTTRYPQGSEYQPSRNAGGRSGSHANRGNVEIPRDPNRATSQPSRNNAGQYRNPNRYSQGAQSGTSQAQRGSYGSAAGSASANRSNVGRVHAGNAHDARTDAAHRQAGRTHADATASGASAYSRESGYSARGGHNADYLNPKKKRSGKGLKIIIAIVIVAVLAVGGYFGVTYLLPVKITLNGEEFNVNGAKTIQAAYEQSGLKLSPGNYVDVTGTILEIGRGRTYDAKLNDAEVTDMETKLSSGDNLVLSNGSDICEDHTETTEEISPSFTIEDTYGALHVYEGTNLPGVQTTMVGSVSGKTFTKVTKEPGNVTLVKYNADPSEKVIALTFDDGPTTYTQQVLDVLAKYDAKATFFTIGMQIETETEKAWVKAEADAGHQVCTHTQTHATTDEGTQGDLGNLSAEEQIQEVVKGLEAVKAATGKEASKVFRAPGGNFSDETATLLNGYVTAEIGWNIDTRDWSCPGTSYIVEQLLSAASGDIVLMHDGGGDRSQTVAALEQALPQLVAAGYKFVTIDELIAYGH